MHIRSNQVLFYLLDKWRGNVASLSFDGSRISASGSRKPSIELSGIPEAPAIKRRWIGDELSVGVASGSARLRIRSGDRTSLARFSRELEQAWREYNIEQLRVRSDVIGRILATIRELDDPARYMAACLVRPALVEAQHLETQLFSKLNMDAIGEDNFQDIATIRTFIAAPRKLRTEAITKFERKQLERWADFFDSFETNPLTPEQRLAVIADEDATLVLAGAGSGKTSVITAKAGYLIKAGIRKPHEILLLAFARNAATEMSERIEDRCGEPVEARTFHALAYDIIGSVEGGKPALAAHATDQKAFFVLIRDILVQLATKVSTASTEEHAIRVIRRAPDEISSFGSARILSDTTTVDVRVSELVDPRPDDLILFGTESFVIQGEPVRDRERLVWTLDLRPA